MRREKTDTDIYYLSLQTEKYGKFCLIELDKQADDYIQDVASCVRILRTVYMAMHTLQMKKVIADTKRLAAILHQFEESVVCKIAREVTPQLTEVRGIFHNKMIIDKRPPQAGSIKLFCP